MSRLSATLDPFAYAFSNAMTREAAGAKVAASSRFIGEFRASR